MKLPALSALCLACGALMSAAASPASAPAPAVSAAASRATPVATATAAAPAGARAPTARRASTADLSAVDAVLAAHPGRTGSYVLERGEEALLARAWLVDHARTSIEVQYFIWSTDNIGILAAEALLRAAERGVRVRVIVDDLLMSAPDRTLLALARHPNIEIRIYNPVHSVGTTLPRRVLNIVTDFRGANQRMHDKTLIVDGRAAITGGRNMADEYFDFDHEYNFRDRDALVLGPVAAQMRARFDTFWTHPLCVPVEDRFAGTGVLDRRVAIEDADVRRVYDYLHAYARAPVNFAPEIRAAIDAIPTGFATLAARLSWGPVELIGDRPGKNDGSAGLRGGGLASAALGRLLGNARRTVTIQSPYLIASEPVFAIFRELRARGVEIRISTNSLASTDNLQAFSGYRNQRAALLALGVKVYEFRPNPAIQQTVMQRYAALAREAPIFALHAKTLVVDGQTVFVGTYNLDPRSENLNTEVGIAIHDPGPASEVEAAILRDMRPENSWDAARDDPDRYASFAKRARVSGWQIAPIESIL